MAISYLERLICCRKSLELPQDSDFNPCHAEIKMPRPLLIFSQSDYLICIVAINSHTGWQTVQIQISWLLHCLQRQGILIVLGFNNTSTLVGHFVSSPREREKRDRRDRRRDEREEQGRQRNRNEREETEIKTLPLYLYQLQG